MMHKKELTKVYLVNETNDFLFLAYIVWCFNIYFLQKNKCLFIQLLKIFLINFSYQRSWVGQKEKIKLNLEVFKKSYNRYNIKSVDYLFKWLISK